MIILAILDLFSWIVDALNQEPLVIGVPSFRDVSDFIRCREPPWMATRIITYKPMLPHDTRIFVIKNTENIYSILTGHFVTHCKKVFRQEFFYSKLLAAGSQK